MKQKLFRNLLFLGMFMLCGYSYAQSISGTVTDANGLLPGVNVIVKGTTNGVTTDFDGNYSIEVSQGEILEFSSLGLKTKIITISNQTIINVALETDIESILLIERQSSNNPWTQTQLLESIKNPVNLGYSLIYKSIFLCFFSFKDKLKILKS